MMAGISTVSQAINRVIAMHMAAASSEQAELLREGLERSMSMTLLEREEHRAASYNATSGEKHLLDGYDCGKCKNRGDFLVVVQQESSMIYVRSKPCECTEVRESLRHLKASGQEGLIDRCRFDNYLTPESWQEKAKDKAMTFAKDDGDAWFFIGGQVGAGKTHLCTAIARERLLSQRVKYEIWPEVSGYLKSIRFANEEEYNRRLITLKQVPVLYLDDFMKIVKDRDGYDQKPSAADVQLAHEILNAWYLSRRKTIISSERMLSEIQEIDAAIAGRIGEMARGYSVNIAREEERDYRMAR